MLIFSPVITNPSCASLFKGSTKAAILPSKVFDIDVALFAPAGTYPALGLSPTLEVWEVNEASNIQVISGASMSEIGDGFYKYVFLGYDTSKDYTIRADGGAILSVNERYSVAGVTEFLSTIREGVFDAQAADYTAAGTVGLKINEIAADTTQLRLDVTDMTTLVELLVKFERNRTRIDKAAKTLTVYDDDKTTPLHVFQLKDGTGALSTDEVCERDPV